MVGSGTEAISLIYSCLDHHVFGCLLKEWLVLNFWSNCMLKVRGKHWIPPTDVIQVKIEAG